MIKTIHSRELKPENGFKIVKSWLVKGNGQINKDTIRYDVYDNEGGHYDEFRTLSEARKYCR